MCNFQGEFQMNLTYQQAIDNIKSFYEKFIPSNSVIKNSAVEVFTNLVASGHSIESIYEVSIAQATLFTGTAAGAFPNPTGTPSEMVDSSIMLGKVNTSALVDFVYKGASASDKAAVVDTIKSGGLSVSDFVTTISILAPTSQKPTPAQIVDASEEGITTGIQLPQAGIQFAGLTHTQEKFLVSLYIGAFSRAPEYEGLKYWANELANNLSHNMSVNDAYLAVGANMYKAGAGNGEGGTTLGNADYVDFAYKNALGREPDAAGKAYWIQELSSGHIERGQFLTTFLTAAGNSERDNSFLQARIAVGEFAAQEHVSGPKAPGIDSHGIIQSVTDSQSALSVINSIITKYGNAADAAIQAEVVFWHAGDMAATYKVADAPETQLHEIQLSGQASHDLASLAM